MSKRGYFIVALVLGLTLFFVPELSVVGEDSQLGKIVTLYQNGSSQVVDRRDLWLDKGMNRLVFSVPDSIIARTIFASAPETNFKNSRVIPGVTSEGKLLERLAGTRVLVTTEGNSNPVVEGFLIGIFDGNPLLETPSGEMRLIKNPKEYRFQGFSAEDQEAQLELQLATEKEVSTVLTLGYQLAKLNWSPQYVGFLDEEEEVLNLQGIANIVNNTGWDFHGVQLRLLAGEPKREERRPNYAAEVRSLSQQEAPSPEQVFEYYRYELGFAMDLASGVETQVKFLHRDSVNYRKYYLFEPSSSSAIRTMLELKNTEEAGLGLPIASGTVRIYENTEDKTFIGEDSLESLSVGRQAELELGDAFDVQGDRKITSHEKIEERTWRDEVKITIDNSKEKPVQLIINERLRGAWEITQSSHDYERVDSQTIRYDENVPAKGTVEISYFVRYEL